MDNKITALYFRSAHNSNDSAYIDNQMQKLMDFARGKSDVGVSAKFYRAIERAVKSK